MLAIELDGRVTHSYLQSRSDRMRQSDLVLLGWRVLRFSYDDVTRNPGYVLEQMRAGFAGANGGQGA